MGMEGEARLTADELGLWRRLHRSLPGFIDSPTPSALALPDARVLMVNRAMERLLGYTRDELLGISGLSLVARHERERITQRHRGLARGDADVEGRVAEDTYHITAHMLRRDKTEIAVRSMTLLLRSASGEPVATLTRFIPLRDASEPRDVPVGRLDPADAQLLHDALTELPSFDSLLEPSTLTSPRGILLHVNPSFTETFGWARREVAGMQASELLTDAIGGWAEQRLRQIAGASLLPPPSAVRLRHRDGRAVPVRAASVPVRDPAGTMRYILATLTPLESPPTEHLA